MICRRVSHLNRFKGISQHIQEYNAGVFRHAASSARILNPVTTRVTSTGPMIKPTIPMKGTPARIPIIIITICTATLFPIIKGRYQKSIHPMSKGYPTNSISTALLISPRLQEVKDQNEDQDLPRDERDQYGNQIDVVTCRFSSKEILICYQVPVIKTWTRHLLNQSS